MLGRSANIWHNRVVDDLNAVITAVETTTAARGEVEVGRVAGGKIGAAVSLDQEGDAPGTVRSTVYLSRTHP